MINLQESLIYINVCISSLNDIESIHLFYYLILLLNDIHARRCDRYYYDDATDNNSIIAG